ncbi:MAG: hypothetical protein PHE55_15180 [Methylococcaceae bacterium]|nr:hypothetical protein [Methylococcaceae bacterium]
MNAQLASDHSTFISCRHWITAIVLASIMLCSSKESVALDSPPPSIAPFAGEGAPEPAVAVGKRFVYAISTSGYRVYPRRADGSVDTENPVVKAYTPLANIFQPVITKLNKQIKYAASSGIQTCPDSLAGSVTNLSKPSEEKPKATGTLSNVGCIGVPYDADVYYDAQRGLFWIMAHLRPMIWKCKGKEGYFSYADDFGTCHPADAATLKQMLHRYTAVAVTKASSFDSENPLNGFRTFVLVDDYGDWPQMMVHDSFLLLNTRNSDTNNRVYVFNANDLAYGKFTPDQAILTVGYTMFDADGTSPGSQGALNGPAVDWMNNQDATVNMTTPIFFVKQSGATDGVTYMVAGSGNQLAVFGLKQTLGSTGPIVPVTRVMPAVLDMGGKVPENAVPAAFSKGLLYWAWTVKDAGGRPYIRSFRIGVHQASHTWNGVHPIFASNHLSSGYLEADIGVGDTANAYALPVMNVTSSGNIVTLYSRYNSNSPFAPVVADLRYAVIPKGQTFYSHSWLLAAGAGNSLLCIPASAPPKGAVCPPGKGGVIDVASVVQDPLDPNQIFMGDAYSNTGGGYTAIVAAVKP